MELIALLLLAPLVMSAGQTDVEPSRNQPVALAAVATFEQNGNDLFVHPPEDSRYTMTVLRHVESRSPAGLAAPSLEVVVSAP